MDHQSHKDERRYTAPISIPSRESTPLLRPPNPSPTKWYSNFMQNCRSSPIDNGLIINSVVTDGAETQSDRFLSCSPMVSGLRTLHLPNLELRDATALAVSRALRGIPETSSVGESLKNRPEEKIEGRKRSKSLGSERERFGNFDRPAIAARITPFYQEELGRVSSGLSLCLVDNEHDANYDGQLHYGAIGFEHAEPLSPVLKQEDPDATTFSLNTSQSCTIPNLGVESPRPSSSTTTSERSPKNRIDEQKQSTKFDPIDNQSPQSPLISLLYGLVNSSIILPILMSFGSIIYHDDFFRPYLSTLMKLTVLSGAIHQITFSTVSSLPFAVGQVQDAGLIFLSAISRDLVNRLQSRGEEVEVVLATVCVGLSLCTALLGGALILVGKWRLASYMQLLPSCVVGGYLAYIGFFCGQAGLALMARKNITGLNEWNKLCNHYAIIRIVPGIIGGSLIYFAVGKFRHMAVLPSCIVLLMLIFYIILWFTGTTVQEATENGWINESAEHQDWKHTWDFLRIDKVVWSVLPSQIGTLLAMISVVALSSSLDIAAIEIELKRPLDYNHELATVGLSNIISGMTGGYTGSYIFSQTIFSLRMGIRSRLMGYVISVVSIVAVVIPFNVLSYIPNAFFGSLLMLICLDLMFEWLIDVRSKMTPAEYAVVLATFILLQVLGVAFGILAGVMVYFVSKKLGLDVGREKSKSGDVVAL